MGQMLEKAAEAEAEAAAGAAGAEAAVAVVEAAGHKAPAEAEQKGQAVRAGGCGVAPWRVSSHEELAGASNPAHARACRTVAWVGWDVFVCGCEPRGGEPINALQSENPIVCCPDVAHSRTARRVWFLTLRAVTSLWATSSSGATCLYPQSLDTALTCAAQRRRA